MMHISMIFDPDTCICDAGFFCVGRTDQPTDEQADSRSWILKNPSQKYLKRVSTGWIEKKRIYLHNAHILLSLGNRKIVTYSNE